MDKAGVTYDIVGCDKRIDKTEIKKKAEYKQKKSKVIYIYIYIFATRTEP